VLILLKYSLGFVDTYWPRWTKPFLREIIEKSDELETSSTQRPLSATFGLLVIALIGLTFQILTIFFPLRELVAIWPAAAWVRMAQLLTSFS
jgi:hypothetical protein